MKPSKKNQSTTIDPAEVAQFGLLADQWWDEKGPFKPLHRLNPVRLRYIRDQIQGHFETSTLKNLKILDIGCGGGLVCEPLTRLGAKVTGVDAAAENIAAAKLHAEQAGLKIDYLCDSAENLAAQNKKFDVVLALEIVEHVADVPLFLSACRHLVKKEGLLILSTLNRTAKSFALGIVAAEYILRWVPAGTHDWRKFLKPSEIATHLKDMQISDVTGLTFQPLTGDFDLSKKDLDVNYFISAKHS